MPISQLNKRICGLVAAILVFATVVAAMLLLSAEPKFEGKSFSYWLDQLPSIDIGVDGRSESIAMPGSYRTAAELVADEGRVRSNIQQAHRALDKIGTNFLSILVARLKLKDSGVMIMVWNWAERLQIIDDAGYPSAHFRRGQALHAFTYLRGRARPAVPQLLELTTNQNTNTQLLAWSALELVAPAEFHKRKHPPIIQHAPQ